MMQMIFWATMLTAITEKYERVQKYDHLLIIHVSKKYDHSVSKTVLSYIRYEDNLSLPNSFIHRYV